MQRVIFFSLIDGEKTKMVECDSRNMQMTLRRWTIVMCVCVCVRMCVGFSIRHDCVMCVRV